MKVDNWLQMYIIFVVLSGLTIALAPQEFYTYIAFGLMWFSLGGVLRKLNE